MSPRRLAASFCLLTLVPAVPLAAEDPVAPAAAPAKLGVPAARLLLPFFEVDAGSSTGPTAFYAIRNESAVSAVDVVVRYYEVDVADTPQFSETLTLAPKATRTIDVRSRLDDLQVDLDGFARGYVVFATDTGAATIHGDHFKIHDGEDFASGFRLLDVDPESRANDLCTRFSIRYLDSVVAFDSGTTFDVWFEPADPYEGVAFSYTVYDLSGTVVLSSSFPSSRFALQTTAGDLLAVFEEEFGAIEFEFPSGTVGHVSATMSALGRYSVGFEATCLDAE